MATALINTPLQRGVEREAESGNRFNGFDAVRETVETVLGAVVAWHTPLKRGLMRRYSEKPQLMRDFRASATPAGRGARVFDVKTRLPARS